MESTNLLDSLGESFLLHMVNIDICAAWQNNNFVYTNVNKAYNAYLCPQSHVIKQSKGRHVATHAHPSGTTLLNLLLGNDPLLQTSVMLIVMPLWNRIIRFTCCSIETSYGLTVSWQKTLKTTRQDCMKACEYLFSPWFGAAEWRMSVSNYFDSKQQISMRPDSVFISSQEISWSRLFLFFWIFRYSERVSLWKRMSLSLSLSPNFWPQCSQHSSSDSRALLIAALPKVLGQLVSITGQRKISALSRRMSRRLSARIFWYLLSSFLMARHRRVEVALSPWKDSLQICCFLMRALTNLGAARMLFFL